MSRWMPSPTEAGTWAVRMLVRWWRTSVQTARLAIGIPDYDNYVEHVRRSMGQLGSSCEFVEAARSKPASSSFGTSRPSYPLLSECCPGTRPCYGSVPMMLC